MKVTSVELDDYIYVTVTSKLKGIKLGEIPVENPLYRLGLGDSFIDVRKEPFADGRRFAHRYERYAAERKQKLQIIFYGPSFRCVMGELDKATKKLTLYHKVCERKQILPLMARIYQQFDKSSPHYKVEVKKEYVKEFKNGYPF